MKEFKRLTNDELNDFISRVVVQLDPTLTQQVMSVVLELEEYRAKIENKTLIELPCPIGTAIYYLDCNQHDGWWIEARLFDLRSLDLIGKYAFITKAEAEAKLKELQYEN